LRRAISAALTFRFGGAVATITGNPDLGWRPGWYRRGSVNGRKTTLSPCTSTLSRSPLTSRSRRRTSAGRTI
jgi:hypothetical protein